MPEQKHGFSGIYFWHSMSKGHIHYSITVLGEFVCFHQYLDVSNNRGAQKWMVKIMKNPIKMDDLGVPLFLETPTSRSSKITKHQTTSRTETKSIRQTLAQERCPHCPPRDIQLLPFSKVETCLPPVCLFPDTILRDLKKTSNLSQHSFFHGTRWWKGFLELQMMGRNPSVVWHGNGKFMKIHHEIRNSSKVKDSYC